jgi:hypothetical protein
LEDEICVSEATTTKPTIPVGQHDRRLLKFFDRRPWADDAETFLINFFRLVVGVLDFFLFNCSAKRSLRQDISNQQLHKEVLAWPSRPAAFKPGSNPPTNNILIQNRKNCCSFFQSVKQSKSFSLLQYH